VSRSSAGARDVSGLLDYTNNQRLRLTLQHADYILESLAFST
jgi:hypothetical protein